MSIVRMTPIINNQDATLNDFPRRCFFDHPDRTLEETAAVGDQVGRAENSEVYSMKERSRV